MSNSVSKAINNMANNYTIEVDGSCDTHGPWRSTIPNGCSTFVGCPACNTDAVKRIAEGECKLIATNRRNAYIQINRDKSGIPGKYSKASFSDYKPTCEGGHKALKICLSYADKFAELSRKGVSMVFSGDVGTGKTHLACSIANSVLESGQTVKYSKFMDIITDIRSTWGKSNESEREALDRYNRYHLLVIDEIGASRMTDDEKLILFRILDSRYDDEKPNLLITNLNKADFVQVVGKPSHDRLRENGGKIVVFDWDSYRGKA